MSTQQKTAKLILHIGSPKTGTSALQRTLLQNTDYLADQGIFYRPTAGVNHRADLRPALVSRDIHQLLHILESQLSMARESECHTLVLSLEGLISSQEEIVTGFDRFLAGNGISAQIVCYLRSYAEFMSAAWQQWYFKDLSFEGPEDFINRSRVFANWGKGLARWEKLDNSVLLIRPYVSTRLHGQDITQDFMQTVGLTELLSGMEPAVTSALWGNNNSFNKIGMSLLESLRQLCKSDIHDHSLQIFLSENYRESVFGGLKDTRFFEYADVINQNAENLVKFLNHYQPGLGGSLLANKREFAGLISPEVLMEMGLDISRIKKEFLRQKHRPNT